MQWPKKEQFAIPHVEDHALQSLAEAHLHSHWVMGEANLLPGDGEWGDSERRWLRADGEIVGFCAAHRCDPIQENTPRLKRWSADRLRTVLTPNARGDWALKTGLYFDPRLRRRYDRHSLDRLLRLAGPVLGALVAQRLGLKGYLAAIALQRRSAFAPALDSPAFVQQVEAGCIEEPLLKAHFCYGARPVAIVDDRQESMVIVQWHRR